MNAKIGWIVACLAALYGSLVLIPSAAAMQLTLPGYGLHAQWRTALSNFNELLFAQQGDTGSTYLMPEKNFLLPDIFGTPGTGFGGTGAAYTQLSGNVTPGNLNASAAVRGIAADPPDETGGSIAIGGSSSGFLQWRDEITVTSDTLPRGTPAQLRLTLDVTDSVRLAGREPGTGGGGAEVIADVSLGSPSLFFQDSVGSPAWPSTKSQELVVSTTVGSDVLLDETLSFGAGAGANTPDHTVVEASATAIAVVGLDAITPGTSYASASGTSYGGGSSSSGNTLVGFGVHVSPNDRVALNFASVTAAGDTTATPLAEAPPAPAGFEPAAPGSSYDIATTAGFTGPVEICISYAGIVAGSSPRLFHLEGDVWKDVTGSLDTASQRVCGTVTSLSPFAVFGAPPPTLHLPGDLAIEATGPDGTRVSYDVTATSVFDSSPTLSCDPASGSLFAIGKTRVTCTSQDSGVGVTTGSFDVTVADTRAPDVSCASSDSLWHAANVSLACTATDGGSGLASASDAAFSLSTSVPAGAETSDAATDSRRVCDVAGNCATVAPIGGNKVDRKAPVLHVPAPIVVNATSPAGAAVPFTATATDGADPNPAVACLPAQGGMFAIGTVTVICTATDLAGNNSTESFPLTVKGAPEQIVDLANEMLAYVRKPALAAPLQTRLRSVAAALIQKRPATACKAMAAFTAVVKRMPGSILTTAQSQQLVADATRIRVVIGC
jgi:hypothetical protein